MKALNVFALLMIILMGSAEARIAKVADNALDDDLNFKLDQDEQEIREVASDENKDEVKDENSENSEQSERDVASENEKVDMKIQYWKY